MESDPRIGTVLDSRYKIIEQIASGGMGAVYRAERVKLGRTVAIKFLHAWSASHQQARKRFDLEAQAMARLDHPNCASVIDFGVVDAVPYVVMEYVSGETLRDIIDRGPVDVTRAMEIMRQVLLGLAHAHEQGIIHRDMKPANVMVGNPTGVGIRAKILDFGLARLQDVDTRVTAQGKVLGTPAYMAPEQTRAGAVDERSDIYACGVLLFEMLTGRKPFEGEDAIEILQKQRREESPRLSSVIPRDFGALEYVVARALNKEPSQRFQSAPEFASALAHTQRAAQHQPELTARVPRSIDSKKVALVGLGLVLLLGMIVAVVASESADSTESAALAMDAAPQPLESVDAAVTNTDSEPDLPGHIPPLPELAEAKQLIAEGRKEQAIQLLQNLQQEHPEVGYISYLMGRLYFDKLWWKNGMTAYRQAIALEPDYRAYEPLIQSVLRGFVVSADDRPDLAEFLYSEIGDAAIPLLEQTASYHTKPGVRNRAARLLRRFKNKTQDKTQE